MVSTNLSGRNPSGCLPCDNFHVNKSLICSCVSTAPTDILPFVLVTNSIAKPVPESREDESHGTLNEGGGEDAALEPLFNIDEAAGIIGRAHWTLRRDIRRGKLRCIRIGRRIMIEQAEIRRIIDEGRG